jgi:hypothetical protein
VKILLVSWFVITIVCISPLVTWAQGISYSPYSVYGIGVLKQRTSAHNRALAETGIGMRDPANLNALNPASYTSIKTITQIAELGLFVESNRLQTEEETDSQTNGNMTSLNLWFRFSKKWAGTVGLAPFSIVNYDIKSMGNVGAEENVSLSYKGSGGLTQFYFGNSVDLLKNLSIGVNASYIFGDIEREESILSGRSEGLSLKNTRYMHKIHADVGLQYTVFSSATRSLTIGSTYTHRVRLNTSGTTNVLDNSITATQDTLYTNEVNVNDYTLPSQWGLGVSYQLGTSVVAVDAQFRDWSKAKIEQNVDLRNTTRLSLAYEYKGKSKPLTYLNVIALRTGFYIQNSYLNINSSPFNEWGFILGAGFPVGGNGGLINVSYSRNYSGTLNRDLIKQQSQVIVLDFVIRDLWGIRRKFD